MKSSVLWLVRKALYVAIGAALAALAAYVSGNPDMGTWKLMAVMTAVGSQVARSLVTNLLPGLYELLGGKP